MIWSRFARLTAALAVLIGLLASPLLGSMPVAAQDGELYDLAATIVAPDALDIAEGDEQFGISGGNPLSFERFMEQEFGNDLDPEAAEQFEDIDWLGGHFHQYDLLGSDDPEDFSRGYQIFVSQYADDDVAEAAFELIDLEAPRIDTELEIGDDSYLIEVTTTAGGPIAADTPTLKLTVLTDDVILSIRIVDVTTGDLVDQEAFEPLAEAFLERIDAVREGEAPRLGVLVQHVELDGAQPMSGDYRRLDGEPIQRIGQTVEDSEAATGTDTIHAYMAQMTGPNPDTAVGGEVAYTVTLYVFEDEDTAADFLGDAEDFIANQQRVESVEPIESSGLVGDASVAFEVSSASSQGRPFIGTAVLTQVGESVAQVRLIAIEAEDAFPVEPVEVLAEVQAECLEAGECADAISLADVLSGDSSSDADEDASSDEGDDEDTSDEDADADASDEDTSDSDDADNDEDTSADTDLEVYESPQYGFTLSYDPEIWSIEAEDSDPDDAYDRITLRSEFGFVSIVGDPDYRPSAMDSCVSDYVGGFERVEGVSNVEPIDGDEGSEEDRAWMAVTYENEGSDGRQVAGARYMECRVLDDVTVVILQTGLERDYEELSDLREELLEGLEAA